ncbi:MAG: hypothetical protein PHP92_04100 [Candidatus Nanoarchaeia archaeon]|nr:hypothetical protein [Candidatus Nanoarchaeia archaeon]
MKEMMNIYGFLHGHPTLEKMFGLDEDHVIVDKKDFLEVHKNMNNQKIINTNKDEVHPEWIMGGNPFAIEQQEKRGQEQLCQSSQLPINGNFGDTEEYIEEKYNKHNIKIIGKSQNDNLFFDVELPNGWKIVPTEHSMWSELLNDKGEVIADIFYKAAFYDRKAHIAFRLGEK